MIRRCFVAVLVAALLAVQMPADVMARDGGNDKNERRDTHSRNEQTLLQILPLLLGNDVQLRLIMMIIIMHNITYQMFMAPGVKVTSQNRIGLGGLFGGVFGKTYGASDFLKSLEVGSVYLADKDRAAIVLKGDLRLEDYRVIVFNGENQYDVTGAPQLQQVDLQALKQLSAITMVAQLLSHTLTPQAFNAVAEMQQNATVSADLTPQQQTDIPLLRQHLIGKVYIGADNTLLIVIPPALVLDR